MADKLRCDVPPHGNDWCPNGCQILYSMECGICGYDGDGVWADEVRSEYEEDEDEPGKYRLVDRD